MQKKTFEEINEEYSFEIDRIVKTIKKQKAKKVLLQFPEGLKPYSTVVCQEIEKRAKTKCFIWMGSCFGACDVPIETEKMGVDLIIQFGHSSWKHKRKDIKIV